MHSRVKQAGIASYWLRRCLLPYSSLAEGDHLVLDVGSGNSPYRDLWQHARYLAIDLTSRDTDVLGDICGLPVKSGSADLVVCTEILEHVFDTREGLAELNRALRTGGYLELPTPLIMSKHEVYDYYRFTLARLERHLKACGFESEEISTPGGIFSCVGLLLTHLTAQVVSRSRSNRAGYRDPGNCPRRWTHYGGYWLLPSRSPSGLWSIWIALIRRNSLRWAMCSSAERSGAWHPTRLYLRSRLGMSNDDT